MNPKWDKSSYLNNDGTEIEYYTVNMFDSFLDIDKVPGGWKFRHSSGYGPIIYDDEKIYKTLKNAKTVAIKYAKNYVEKFIKNLKILEKETERVRNERPKKNS